MKTSRQAWWKRSFIWVLVLTLSIASKGQGRVVINEYMPWTPSSCGPTADFVELLNFGPGPVNIGCYILTDGDHAITIPANTILQVGEYYLISGQDILPYPCANIDSTVHADLNWNTCGCTSGTIPTTGDGFLTDGGTANEQVVLLDPNLNVVDAVARSLPVEPSSLITTSTNGGTCLSQVFDLDLMTINYETIGESAGRGNSFARKLDGDCGWVKDPQQSGNATNNTPGDASSVSYNMTITSSMACPYGAVSISVNSPSGYGDIFPMTYTLAYDSNGNDIFDLDDQYSIGYDNSPNTIEIDSLPAGLYRVTLASARGCNLHTLTFRILDCFPLLPVKLIHFGVSRQGDHIIAGWQITNHELVSSMEMQWSTHGYDFDRSQLLTVKNTADQTVNYQYPLLQNPDAPFIRLLIRGHDGRSFYSPVIDSREGLERVAKLWPNPATDLLNISVYSTGQAYTKCTILSSQGQLVAESSHFLKTGDNHFYVPTAQLPKGSYFMILTNSKSNQVILSSRFIKN